MKYTFALCIAILTLPASAAEMPSRPERGEWPPVIGAWFWTERDLEPEGYKSFLDAAAERSPYTLLSTACRRIEVVDPQAHQQADQAVWYAATRGLKVALELDIRLARQAFRAKYPDEQQEELTLRFLDFADNQPAEAVFEGVDTADHMNGSLLGLTRPKQNEAGLFSRSLVSTGDLARIERTLAKARRGETITVGVIGGSITAGARASRPERCYGQLLASWWRKTFPKSNVKFVNAGIGATGSDYGALRVKRDLLSQHPDFVVVEYAVNDPNTRGAAETLEGLVRQILRAPRQPAVLLLFTMQREGANAQEWQSKVGRHYDLPMVSFRDALWPQIKQGTTRWNDIEADEVHPNDLGHDYCARFITRFLDQALADLPDESRLPQIQSLPQPLLSDQFEHVALFEADALEPLVNQGWTNEASAPAGKCWKADQPGSLIEFEVPGRILLLMDWHIRGPMGQASVRVDEQPPIIRDGWFDQTWGGYRQTTVLARDLAPGKHRVRVELLPEKSPQSTGHEVRIMGLGSAGIEVNN